MDVLVEPLEGRQIGSDLHGAGEHVLHGGHQPITGERKHAQHRNEPAVLGAASEVPGGILATELGSDGSGGDALIVPGGGSAMPTSLETVSSGQHYVKMDGKAVFQSVSCRGTYERLLQWLIYSSFNCKPRLFCSSSIPPLVPTRRPTPLPHASTSSPG